MQRVVPVSWQKCMCLVFAGLFSVVNAAALEAPQLVKPIRSVLRPVVVAVIDSGSPKGNPDMAGIMLPGLSLAGGAQDKNSACPEGPSSFDQGVHGDQVARLIAAHSAPFESGSLVHASILPIYVYGKCKVTRTDMMAALKWAAGLPVAGFSTNPNPARVINLSLSGGGSRCGADLQQLVDQLLSMNIYVVAAAGNSFHQRLREPANCEGVIAVGASDEEGRIADYSALDERIAVYAFGGDVPLAAVGDNPALATLRSQVAGLVQELQGGGPLQASGTSYAAPVVSGYLAMWLSRNPDKWLDDFKEELKRVTYRIAPPPDCPRCAPRTMDIRF